MTSEEREIRPRRKVVSTPSPHRLLLFIENGAQCGDVARSDLASDLTGDRRFDQLAALEHVMRVGDRRRRDKGAAMARERQDMIMGERLQGAGHDGAADAEPRRELL